MFIRGMIKVVGKTGTGLVEMRCRCVECGAYYSERWDYEQTQHWQTLSAEDRASIADTNRCESCMEG